MLPSPYYQDESCTIYHADCREIIPYLPKVDLVVTDPPYGINHTSGHGASWSGTVIAHDDSVAIRDAALSQLEGIPAVVFGTWKTPKPANVRSVLIFDKGPAFGMGDLSFPWKPSFEEIYIIGNGFHGSRDEGVIKGHIQVSWESKGRCHPNQKPLSLITYLLSKHSASVVLDPFMGSGTTLVAAKNDGRRAIGIELEEKYCQIAVDRLRQESLFALERAEPLNTTAGQIMLGSRDLIAEEAFE